jgi:hypothetical protein
VISASFSFSAGESSTTDEVRRGGRLVELTERDTEREGLREAMTVPASRGQVRMRVRVAWTANQDDVVLAGASQEEKTMVSDMVCGGYMALLWSVVPAWSERLTRGTRDFLAMAAKTLGIRAPVKVTTRTNVTRSSPNTWGGHSSPSHRIPG